jgi:hypothetical protein
MDPFILVALGGITASLSSIAVILSFLDFAKIKKARKIFIDKFLKENGLNTINISSKMLSDLDDRSESYKNLIKYLQLIGEIEEIQKKSSKSPQDIANFIAIRCWFESLASQYLSNDEKNKLLEGLAMHQTVEGQASYINGVLDQGFSKIKE